MFLARTKSTGSCLVSADMGVGVGVGVGLGMALEVGVGVVCVCMHRYDLRVCRSVVACGFTWVGLSCFV